MNLFYLDKNPKICAQMHNNQHCIKMIVETAQMLSTAHRVLDGDQYIELSKKGRRIKRWKLQGVLEKKLYKATHINHPSAAWIRECPENYQYAYALLNELCIEYTHRYGKIHKTELLLEYLKNIPANIGNSGFSEPPKCMPDYCKLFDTVQSYRNYYKFEKSEFNDYKNRSKPYWL